MWQSHNFLVPHLNGETYSHKPPLLFWLMNVGWAVFGVNDWWPRLVPSLFALGAVLMTQRIAKRLWPQSPQTTHLSALILLGSALWTVFTTATMFDMMVSFFTVWGALGLLVAWQDRSIKGWLMLSLAFGFGLLAKGPTILLQILPIALLAPWWMKSQKPNWRWWYARVVISVLVGAAIVLAWAIPAGIVGGPQYQHEIFWGQTADRMVKSFAHRRPLWWYLPVLPLILFPWLFALPVWRALGHIKQASQESAVRFCLVWFVPVFVAFSFISGKQPHYLLPIFPAFALLAARGLADIRRISLLDKGLVAVVTTLVGAWLIYLPVYSQTHHLAPWFVNIPFWAGLLLILGAWWLMLTAKNETLHYAWRATLLSGLAVSVLYVGVIHHAGTAYDIRPISRALKILQTQGVPLANVGKYPGQYNFIGRLTHSPDVVSESDLPHWFETHPNGRAIAYFGKGRELGSVKPEFLQYYLGDQVGILTQAQWMAWIAQPRNSTENIPDTTTE